MTLPDRLERLGIVVGSAFLVSLPVSLLLLALVESSRVWLLGILGFAPGVVVGVLVAKEWIPATYRQVWAASILSWVAITTLWGAFEVEIPARQRGLVVATWALGVGLAVLATAGWSTVRNYRRS